MLIHAEKRYKYEKLMSNWRSDNHPRVVFLPVKVNFVWDMKFKEGLIVIEFDDNIIEPSYNPFSYVSCARAFLKIAKTIEKINTIEELNKFLKTL